MLKSWSIENFKPIVNSGELKLKPVTILAGLNSSGKTSLLQSILMISQTLSNQVVDRPLVLNGPLVQLGTLPDILNHTTHLQTLVVGFELDLQVALQDNPISEDDLYFIEHTGTRARNIKLSANFNRTGTDNTNNHTIENLNSLLESISLNVTPEIIWRTRSKSSSIEHGELEVIISKLTKMALGKYLENVPSTHLRLVPYNGDHPNYLGEVKLTNGQIVANGLITLSHFLPDRFLQKFNLKDRYLEEVLFETSILEHPPFQDITYPDIKAFSIPDDIKKVIDHLIEKNVVSDLPVKQIRPLLHSINALEEKIGKDQVKVLSEKVIDSVNQKIHELELKKDDFSQGLEILNDHIDLLTIDQAVKQIMLFFSSQIRYLGPLRADPQASQKFAPSSELDDVGAKGEYSAAVYEANQATLVDWYNPISKQVEQSTLKDALNLWASYLGVAKQIMINSAGYSGFSWQVVHKSSSEPLPLVAVGFGVSQVLPILVMGLLAPKNTLLIIEQPELHLHPRVQARLGDFFVGLSRCNKQCLIETHSENLVNQLRYHIVESGGQEKSDCMIYFVDQDEQGAAKFEPVEISPKGNILNWPEGFFDETMHQEDKITAASIRRRSKLAQDG